jgi:alpha-tubulin suppressor-like RCC1 family protein
MSLTSVSKLVRKIYVGVNQTAEEIYDSTTNIEKRISAGSNNTMVLLKDNTLWCSGSNATGQLGLGDYNNRTTWTQVTNLPSGNIKQVMCSMFNSIILLEDGTYWLSGSNSPLNVTNEDSIIFSRSNAFSQSNNLPSGTIKEIVCGDDHLFILMKNGTLFGGGNNINAQLGLGYKNNDLNYRDPEYRTHLDLIEIDTLPINRLIKSIYCGESYTFILMEDNTLWGTGSNSSGQLGLGDTTDRTTFTQVTNLPSGNIKQISCGTNYTMMLLENGTLWATGYNYYGTLGLGTSGGSANETTFTQVTNIPSGTIKEIECGSSHSLILFNNGILYVCGYNYSGQLGLGDTVSRTTFTQVTNIPSGTIKQIECGSSYSLILFEDGTILAAGDNYSGQLGLGDTTNRNTFTRLSLTI